MLKKMNVKIISTMLLIVLVSSTLIGCERENTQSNSPISKSSFLLNTIVTITLYDTNDESILDGAMDVCSKYETIFSRTNENSELYKLNHHMLEKKGDSYVVSEELGALIQAGYRYSELSNGAFDLAIEPVSSLWDFQASNPSLPDSKKIEEAIQHVDYTKIKQDSTLITFEDEEIGIDLGAIAKGYIADRIKDYLLEQGVKSAMINLGGNVLCVGKKPDGQPFNIGIQKPYANRNETVAVMQLEDVSVVSSGIYERYFTLDGKTYHHILNPKTGYPYENNLISVTIISKESVDGDGLSTSCFSLGLEKGLELINSLDDVEAVFITDDYQFHYSDTFKDSISIVQN